MLGDELDRTGRMPMAVRRYTRYSAKETITSTFPFACVYCGCAADMTVTETATSTREVGGHGHSAEQQQSNHAAAAEQARKTATTMAKETAGLVPCPSCHKRDEKKVRAHVISTIVWMIVCLGIGGALAYVAVTGVWEGTPRILAGIFGFLALVVAVTIPFTAKKTYDTAPSKATFANVRMGSAQTAAIG
jgi:hypothetical protein